MAILIDFDFVSRTNADTVNASGTVAFYDTGTTTLTPVYSDAALTTVIENPYTLDSAGRFSGPVYCADGARYAIKESDSLGADIRTRDPVWGKIEDAGGRVSAEDFGATGTGTETTELQALLNSGARVVNLGLGVSYTVDAALTVPANTTIEGNGSTITTTVTAGDGLTIEGSNITIRDLTLAGPHSAEPTYAAASKGINATAPSYASRYSNLRLENVTIHGFANSGVWYEYIENLWINDCEIFNCGRSGIYGVSCVHGWVERNNVYSIERAGGTIGTTNAYGITFSRNQTDSAVTDPPSQYIWIKGNRVADVPDWTGIDGHGTADYNIIDNEITGCWVGVGCVPSDGPTVGFPLKRVEVRGNTIQNAASSGKGINIASTSIGTDVITDGVTAHKVIGNTLIGCGTTDTAVEPSGGAIYFSDSDGGEVTGNILINSNHTAIVFANEIEGVTCLGNVINGVATVNGTNIGVQVATPTADILIDDNIFDGRSGSLDCIDSSTVLSAGYSIRVGNGNRFKNYTSIMDSTTNQRLDPELTIAAGVITVTHTVHTVDTESDAASDDLDTINGGYTGMLLVLSAESSSRTVVVKDGTGNLALAGDFSMDNTQDRIVLMYDGGQSIWAELCRSNNGA